MKRTLIALTATLGLAAGIAAPAQAFSIMFSLPELHFPPAPVAQPAPDAAKNCLAPTTLADCPAAN
jgi:hypothetical protein